MVKYLFILGLITIAPRVLADEICPAAPLPSNQLAEIEKILSPLKQRQIKYGNNCAKEFGTDFEQLVNESINDGLKCLNGLNTQSSKDISKKLENLFQDRTNIIECKNLGTKDSTITAESSVDDHQNRPEEKLFHPYLILNADKLKGDDPASKEFLKSTIFHESIHNMSYAHGDGPEIAYTCEACCFNTGSPETRDLACRACGASLGDALNTKYIHAILPWAQATKSTYRLALDDLTYKGLIQEPGSKDYLEALIQIHPFAGEDIINKVMARNLVKNQILNSDKAIEISKLPIEAPAELIQLAEKIVAVRMALLVEGNASKAFDLAKRIDLSHYQALGKKYQNDDFSNLYYGLNDDLSHIGKDIELQKKRAEEFEDFHFQFKIVN
ncbi:hypothetical protein ACJVC5_00595 [Peredibacter sp. HCB2-198]|uniref:hypothetical protein n=1 Tax=Peredibacter sp. HCB2-198 TaxID=3383025 RepID=UPI0038B58043